PDLCRRPDVSGNWNRLDLCVRPSCAIREDSPSLRAILGASAAIRSST
ncbi:unnamed protein product, partial [Mycena citricolor]